MTHTLLINTIINKTRKIFNNPNLCRRMNEHSTGFIGYILPSDSQPDSIYNKIMNTHKILENEYKKFKSQKYPHTTMIYLGKSYEEDTKKLLKDKYFTRNIMRFKKCLCEFSKLKFIGLSLVYMYKFKNNELNKNLIDLTTKYEEHYHSAFKHVTIGSFDNDDDKQKFIKTQKTEIEKVFEGTSFTIDVPYSIRVDTDKKYSIYSTFTEN